MRRLVCAFVVRMQQSQVFQCRGPYKILYWFNNSRKKSCRDPITHSDLSFLESFAAKSLVKSLQFCHCFSSKTEKLKVNSCHEGYFRVLHPTSILSSCFMSFQIKAGIYKHTGKQYRAGPADFLETS